MSWPYRLSLSFNNVATNGASLCSPHRRNVFRHQPHRRTSGLDVVRLSAVRGWPIPVADDERSNPWVPIGAVAHRAAHHLDHFSGMVQLAIKT